MSQETEPCTMVRVIHQIWFQGKDQIPEKYHTNIQDNQKHNSTWKHYIWADEDLRNACRQFSEATLRAYDACEYMFQKIDLGRYVMLYHHGGMSIDMDARCTRPLDEFLPKVPTNVDVVLSEMSIPSFLSRIYGTKFNNAQIYCPRRHSRFMKNVIEECTHRILGLIQEHADVPKYELVQYTTGPVMFFDVYRDVSTSISILQVPSVYFEPCSIMESGCHADKETFIIHEMHQSWISSRERMYVNVLRFVNKNKFTLALSVTLALLIFFYFVRVTVRKYGMSMIWFLLALAFHGFVVIRNDERFSTRNSQASKPIPDILHDRLPKMNTKVKNTLRNILTVSLVLLAAYVVFRTEHAPLYLQMMALTLVLRGVMVASTYQLRTDVSSCTKMTNEKVLGNACHDKWMSLELVSLLITIIIIQSHSRNVYTMPILGLVAILGSVVPVLTRQSYTIDIVISYLWVALLWSKLLPFRQKLS